jgi:hypothetical protein
MSSAVPAPKVTNYQGNSKVAQENAAVSVSEPERVPAKKIEGVTVVKTKKPLGSRIKESFGGQDLRTVGKVLAVTVLLPSAKDLMMKLIEEGGHRIIYGDSSRGVSSSSQTIVGSGSRIRTTNYSAMTASPVVGSRNNGPAISQSQNPGFDFSQFVFPEQDMALEVLEKLTDAIEEFNIVSVADFYDFIGQTGNGFTDQKYGWNIQAFAGAEVKRARGGGFFLNLPTPRAIA